MRRKNPPASKVAIRRSRKRDVDALLALEQVLFTTDRLSKRSFRTLMASPSALVLVAEAAGQFAGYALVLFRNNSRIARLYSIGVPTVFQGRGVGSDLLAAAHAAAIRRRCVVMRLEVQDHNSAAIRRYEKHGYRLCGRAHAYYEDGGDALRFEKVLS